MIDIGRALGTLLAAVIFLVGLLVIHHRKHSRDIERRDRSIKDLLGTCSKLERIALDYQEMVYFWGVEAEARGSRRLVYPFDEGEYNEVGHLRRVLPYVEWERLQQVFLPFSCEVCRQLATGCGEAATFARAQFGIGDEAVRERHCVLINDEIDLLCGASTMFLHLKEEHYREQPEETELAGQAIMDFLRAWNTVHI